MENNNPKRIDWVDSAKGIGIFFVVLGHTALPYAVFRWVFSFHLPAFFFLSGYVYNPQRYSSAMLFLKRKWRTILFPYFLFSAIIYSYWLVAGRFMSGETNVGIYQPIMDIFLSSAYLKSVFVPLWFLTALFLTEVVFFFLERLIKSRFWLFIVIVGLAIAGYYYSSQINFRLPWGADIVPISILFYCLGFLLKNIFINLKSRLWIATGIISFILSCIISTLNGQIDMLNDEYGNFFYFLAAASLGIVFLTILAQRWQAKIWQFWGKNTLIIFSFHFVVLSIIRRLYGIIFPNSNIDVVGQKNIFLGLSLTIICLLVFSGIIYFFKNWRAIVSRRKTA